MGRKIPGKKCKRIKDPEKQHALRLESLKGKINAPPAFPDVQETPHSLERLIHLKDKYKSTKSMYVRKKRKNKDFKIDTKRLVEKDVDLPGMTKPVRQIPNLNQHAGESETHYLNRIERLCQNVIKESKFEKKFGVEVHRNPDTGAIEEVRKCSNEEIMKNKSSKKDSPLNELKNLKRSKCKKVIKKLSKLQKHENDFSHLSDDVSFGEVVHQPPTLKVLPRKVPVSESEVRPGQRDLILKKLLNPNTPTSNTAKLKWKDIPAGDKMRLEQERDNAIKAYKMIKAQKYKPGGNN